MTETESTGRVVAKEEPLPVRLEKSLVEIDSLLLQIQAEEVSDVHALMDSDIGQYGTMHAALNVLGECEAKFGKKEPYKEVVERLTELESRVVDMFKPPEGQDGFFALGDDRDSPYELDAANHTITFNTVVAQSEEACFRCAGAVHTIVGALSDEGVDLKKIHIVNLHGLQEKTVTTNFVSALSGIVGEGKRPQEYYPERYEQMAEMAGSIKEDYDIAALREEASKLDWN